MTMKAVRNKTIDISLEDGRAYLDRVLRISAKQNLDQLLDRMICGNFFDVAPFLPENSVDLLIADPPYNLDKDFHGNRFKQTSDELYEEYTESWVKAVLPLLKKTASIYVCCDWISSPALYRVLKKYFHIRNRITWQREKGRGSLANWKNGMEDIYFATFSGDYTFNLDAVKQRRRVIAPYKAEGSPKDWEETGQGKFRNTCPSNFWDDISIPYWSMAENTAHPTQKPEALVRYLIENYTMPDALVVDPFAGSGTTLAAAPPLV